MSREFEPYQRIERSIITKYKKEIWNPFAHAVRDYDLIQAGDKIAVCISGGKDSMLMAKLIQQLHRHSEVPFDVVYLVMDPGYNEINRQKIESNAKLLHITCQGQHHATGAASGQQLLPRRAPELKEIAPCRYHF